MTKEVNENLKEKIQELIDNSKESSRMNFVLTPCKFVCIDEYGRVFLAECLPTVIEQETTSKRTFIRRSRWFPRIGVLPEFKELGIYDISFKINLKKNMTMNLGEMDNDVGSVKELFESGEGVCSKCGKPLGFSGVCECQEISHNKENNTVVEGITFSKKDIEEISEFNKMEDNIIMLFYTTPTLPEWMTNIKHKDMIIAIPIPNPNALKVHMKLKDAYKGNRLFLFVDDSGTYEIT